MQDTIYMQPLNVFGLLLNHLFFNLLFFIRPYHKEKKNGQAGDGGETTIPSRGTLKKVLSYLLSFVQRRQIAALGRVLPLQGSVLPPIATNIVGSLLIEQ